MKATMAARLFKQLGTRKLSSITRPYFVPYELSFAQRTFLIPYFGLGAILDPRRGDLVAGLGDATGVGKLRHIRKSLMETKAGRKLLLEKPLISEGSLNLLSTEFPDDSLGKKYAEFMKVVLTERIAWRQP